MAVSKRTRFEVLRRDNFTCRYCRSTDNELTVDHVTPVALGGSDDPSNLVAACRDCNAGKASTKPDDHLVAEVREDAIKHARMVQAAYRVIKANLEAEDNFVGEWMEEVGDLFWFMPDNYEHTLKRWRSMGVPMALLTDAARKATTKYGVTKREQFAYMCGIVWNQVREVTDLVSERIDFDGCWRTEDEMDLEREHWWRLGYDTGYERAVGDYGKAMSQLDVVSAVVDRRAGRR